MQASWEDGFDQRVFMERLTKVSAAGGLIAFDGEGSGLIALLRSMVKFSEDLPWGLRSEMLSSAARDAIAAHATTPKELLQHIQLAAKAYADGSKSPFIMFTSISVLKGNKLPRVRVGNAKLTFLESMPTRVLAARAELFRTNRHWLPFDREPNMKAVKVEVEARNVEEAATQCLDAIDLLRGILNFFKTTAWRVTLGGPRKPVSAIFIGPVHTFHDKAGALQANQFWYETNFWRNAEIVDLSKYDSVSVRNTSRVKKMLERHQYRADLENAFVRYARALDLEDHDLAIQKLWSLLEFVTDTGLASYDKTIRRAKFFYDEASFQGQVLEHLRRYRNRSVHGGSSSGDVEVEVYQLKRLVEAALKFHLGNRFKFDSMTDACSFLDLPTNVDQLRVRQRNIRRAIAYRSSGGK